MAESNHLSSLTALASDSEPASILDDVKPRWPASLVGSIAIQLASEIVEAKLRAGDELSSVELARRFNTSRTPVREALLLLEKEGLVEIQSRRCPSVKRWTRAEIRDLYQIRAALSGLVAELVVANASDEELRILDLRCGDLIAAARENDLRRYFRANVAFRETEAQISKNSQIKAVLDSLGLRVLQIRHYSMSMPGGMEEGSLDRQRLMRAYYQRDAALASAINRAVVFQSLRRIEASSWKGIA